MSDVIALGARRAEGSRWADQVSPRDMLLRVIAEIDSGELKADHFILLSGSVDEDKATRIQINQAGSFDRYRQIGLVHRGLKMVEEL